MKTITIFILFFSSGLAVGLYLFSRQPTKVKYENKIKTPTPEETSFQLDPPAQAMVGVINNPVGVVTKHQLHGKSDLLIKNQSSVYSGESLTTGKEGRAVVRFTDFAIVELSTETEVKFVNLLPTSFLISQRKGEASYQLLEDKPLAVTVSNLLVNLNSGKTKVTVKGSQIKIEVITGEVELAMIDQLNQTKTWKLNGGQKASVNDRLRTVRVHG